MKSTFFIAFFIVFLSFFSSAQFGIHPKAFEVPFEYKNQEIKVVDIDNDGSLDIASANANNFINLYFNEGNIFKSNTRKRRLNHYFNNSIIFDLADFNSDFLPDFICLSKETYRTYFLHFKNLGDGNFDIVDTLHLNYGTIDSAFTSLKLIDMNNDGNVDILVSGNHQINLFLGTNDIHNFQNPVTLYSNQNLYLYKTKVLDFNNDGFYDISLELCNNNYSYFNFALVKNVNNVYSTSTIFTSNLNQELSFARYSDIDNDGLVDILCKDNSSQLLIGKNNGGFNFSFSTSSFQYFSSNNFELSDVNNDGYSDIVIQNSNVLTYFPNDLGSFSNSIPSSAISNNEIYNLIIQDFNNDGKEDFLFNSSYGLELKIRSGSGFGETRIINEKLEFHDLELVDFDANGTKDILVTNSWLPNLGNGNFGAPNFFSKNISDILFNSSSGDIDNDGDIDIVSIKENALLEFTNEGNSIDFSQNLLVQSLVHRAELFDINNDNYLDLIYIYSNGSSTNISYKLRTGNSWGNEVLITQLEEALPNEFKFYFSDLNSDAKPDFFIPKYDCLTLFINNGNGFTKTTRYVSGDQFIEKNKKYKVLDFNLDGYKDIILYTYNQNYEYYLSLFLNDGNTNFTAQHLLSSPLNNANIFDLFDDIDGDFDIDYVQAKYGENLHYYENQFNTFDQNNLSDINLNCNIVNLIASDDLFGNSSNDLIICQNEFIYCFENLLFPKIFNPIVNGIPFPNPATNSINLSLPFSQLQSYNVDIFNSFGIFVLSDIVNNENTNLNISTLLPGMYYAKITNVNSSEITYVNFIKN